MDKGIYTALSGTIAKSHEIDLIANNLANASTPGFKRDTGTFNEYIPELRRYDRPVTVRHLLTHTSGVRDYLMLKQYAGIRGGTRFSDEETLALLARQKSLNFTPG